MRAFVSGTAFAAGLAFLLLAVPAPLVQGTDTLLRKEASAAVDVNAAGHLLHPGGAEESVRAEALDAMAVDLCEGDIACIAQRKEEWRIGMVSASLVRRAFPLSLASPAAPTETHTPPSLPAAQSTHRNSPLPSQQPPQTRASPRPASPPSTTTPIMPGTPL